MQAKTIVEETTKYASQQFHHTKPTKSLKSIGILNYKQ